MSAKKNLTIATLVALLAVPAFNGTNVHASSGVSATYEGPSVNIGDGEPEGQFNPGRKITVHPQYQLDGNYSSSMGWVPKQDVKFGNSSSNNGTISNGSENGTNEYNRSNSDSESDESTQYTSQSGQLPQTNENNGASKAMALGASALVASAGLMALSFARKHKYLESVDLASNTDTINASNGKDNNDTTPKYSNKSNYDMIMSDTFDDISKSLKNL